MHIDAGGVGELDRRLDVLRVEAACHDDGALSLVDEFAVELPIMGLPGGSVRTARRIMGIGNECIDEGIELLDFAHEFTSSAVADDDTLDDVQAGNSASQLLELSSIDGPMQLNAGHCQFAGKIDNLARRVEIGDQYGHD